MSPPHDPHYARLRRVAITAFAAAILAALAAAVAVKIEPDLRTAVLAVTKVAFFASLGVAIVGPIASRLAPALRPFIAPAVPVAIALLIATLLLFALLARPGTA